MVWQRISTILIATIFALPLAAADQWTHAEGNKVPTIFFQGMMDSHKQCAKYCGPQGFQALTGQQVSIAESIPLIHAPFIGKELDEVKLTDSDYAWYNPLKAVDAVQKYAFAKQLLKYGYQVQNPSLDGATVATHAIDFFKLNFAQERDIAECSAKIDLADKAYPAADKILWGVSRGAAAVFNAHARHHYKGVKMVVLEGCFDTVDHAMALRLPLAYSVGLTSLFQSFLEYVSEYRRDGVNPVSSIDRFPEGVPVVFITSKADRNVSIDCTKEVIKRLKARGKNPVHVVVLKNSGHNHYALGDGPDQKRYVTFMHRLYKKYNLPYIPEYLGNNKKKQCIS